MFRAGCVMKRFLYILLQCTWGAPQTIVGAVVYLIYRRCPHLNFHGAAATLWQHGGSVSLGAFVFVAREQDGAWRGECSKSEMRVLIHEYGHTIQSLILGPLYLVVIGMPSLLWAGLPFFERKRRTLGISYYWLYTEKWADRLGEAVVS